MKRQAFNVPRRQTAAPAGIPTDGAGQPGNKAGARKQPLTASNAANVVKTESSEDVNRAFSVLYTARSGKKRHNKTWSGAMLTTTYHSAGKPVTGDFVRPSLSQLICRCNVPESVPSELCPQVDGSLGSSGSNHVDASDQYVMHQSHQQYIGMRGELAVAG